MDRALAASSGLGPAARPAAAEQPPDRIEQAGLRHEFRIFRQLQLVDDALQDRNRLDQQRLAFDGRIIGAEVRQHGLVGLDDIGAARIDQHGRRRRIERGGERSRRSAPARAGPAAGSSAILLASAQDAAHLAQIDGRVLPASDGRAGRLVRRSDRAWSELRCNIDAYQMFVVAEGGNVAVALGVSVVERKWRRID